MTRKMKCASKFAALFLTLLSAVLFVDARSQVTFGVKPEKVFRQLYDFNILSADSIVKNEIDLQPDSALWNLLSANVAWMEILAGNLENTYWNQQFKTRIKKAKQNLKRDGVEEHEKLFYYIIVHAFKTRHELLNDNYLNAASDLNTCIDQITESFGREEEFESFYLTSGLYYYFMAKAYEDYILMRPYLMFYPDGDEEKGLDYLNRLTQSENIFLRNEANYFLMRIYFDLEEEYAQANSYSALLVSENPNNLIYNLYHIRILQKMNSPLVWKETQSFREKVSENDQLSDHQKEHFINELNSRE